MCTPGLMLCGSTIHPARLPRVLRIVPAAIVRRLATCVRSGPACDAASVPSTLWHIAQDPCMNTCWPRIATGSVGGIACDCAASAHCLYCAGGSAITCSAIFACWYPQNSAHCPRYTPALSAWNHHDCVRPGTRSFLPARLGTQNEWITSAELSTNSTGCPTGTWISFAVVKRAFGDGSEYVTSHHHWCPVISMVSMCALGAPVIARPTERS